MCESLRYWNLLTTAATLDNSVSRLVFVGSFAVSMLQILDKKRLPFLPLLGETFEYVDELDGLRFIAEHVSSSPPTSACHAETSEFIFWQSCALRVKVLSDTSGGFNRLGGVEVSVEGRMHVLLKQSGQEFDWKFPKILYTRIEEKDSMEVQLGGVFEVVNRKTKEKIEFKFPAPTISERRGIVGTISSSEKGPFKGMKIALFGEWDRQISCNVDVKDIPVDDRGSRHSSKKIARIDKDTILWQNPSHPSFRQQKDLLDPSLNFTHMYELPGSLVELSEFQQAILPPSDARWRPDVAALRGGDEKKAASMNQGLEERQLEVHMAREKKREVWKPQFFLPKKNKSTHEREWTFNNSYWAQRRQNVLLWKQMEGTMGRKKANSSSSPSIFNMTTTPPNTSSTAPVHSSSTSDFNSSSSSGSPSPSFTPPDSYSFSPTPSPVPFQNSTTPSNIRQTPKIGSVEISPPNSFGTFENPSDRSPPPPSVTKQ